MAVDTVAVIKKVIPVRNPIFLNELDKAIKQYGEKYGLTTTKRIAAFLAQCAHECDNFNTLQEYASGKAYEGRKDLGNIYAGDGVKFKGRGYLQTTGRANYGLASKNIFGVTDYLQKNPTLLLQPHLAALASMYYWDSKGLNKKADAGDFAGITRTINGGVNGAADRVNKWNAINAVIAAVSPAAFLAEYVKKKALGKMGSAVAGFYSDVRFFVTGT